MADTVSEQLSIPRSGGVPEVLPHPFSRAAFPETSPHYSMSQE
jgi:hypothetical protein